LWTHEFGKVKICIEKCELKNILEEHARTAGGCGSMGPIQYVVSALPLDVGEGLILNHRTDDKLTNWSCVITTTGISVILSLPNAGGPVPSI
jgi:hypothetical protein